MSALRITRWGVAAALAAAALAGCGGREKVVEVKGRLLKDGQPLHVDPQQREIGIEAVVICFYPIGEDGRVSDSAEMTQANAEGYFSLADHIRPGRYKIAVAHLDEGVDQLGGQFDRDRTPIVREITGEEDLVIDLSKSVE